jgi:hypothetical protein
MSGRSQLQSTISVHISGIALLSFIVKILCDEVRKTKQQLGVNLYVYLDYVNEDSIL